MGALSRVNFVGLLQKEAVSQQRSATTTNSATQLRQPGAVADESLRNLRKSKQEELDESIKSRKSGWGALEDGLLTDRNLALKVSMRRTQCGSFHRLILLNFFRTGIKRMRVTMRAITGTAVDPTPIPR